MRPFVAPAMVLSRPACSPCVYSAMCSHAERRQGCSRCPPPSLCHCSDLHRSARVSALLVHVAVWARPHSAWLCDARSRSQAVGMLIIIIQLAPFTNLRTITRKRLIKIKPVADGWHVFPLTYHHSNNNFMLTLLNKLASDLATNNCEKSH